MDNFRTIVAAFFVVCLIHSNFVAADSRAQRKVCQGKADGVRIANYREKCKSFFICEGGVPHERFCPSGFLFNSINRNCDWSSNVNCVSSTDDTPPSSTRMTTTECSRPTVPPTPRWDDVCVEGVLEDDCDSAPEPTPQPNPPNRPTPTPPNPPPTHETPTGAPPTPPPSRHPPTQEPPHTPPRSPPPPPTQEPPHTPPNSWPPNCPPTTPCPCTCEPDTMSLTDEHPSEICVEGEREIDRPYYINRA